MTAPLSQTLDAELTLLQMDTANFGVLQKITREHERQIMAHAYLWWLQANWTSNGTAVTLEVDYRSISQRVFKFLNNLNHPTIVPKQDSDAFSSNT